MADRAPCRDGRRADARPRGRSCSRPRSTSPTTSRSASTRPSCSRTAMRLLRDAGVRRVNWLSYGSVDPASDLYSPILHRRRVRAGLDRAARRSAGRRGARRACQRARAVRGHEAVRRRDGHHAPAAADDGRALPRIGGVPRRSVRVAAAPARGPDRAPRRRSGHAPRPADVAAIRLTKCRRCPDTHHRRSPPGLDEPAATTGTGCAATCIRQRVREEVRPVAGRGPRLLRARRHARGAPVRSLVLEGFALDEPFVLLTTSFRAADGEPDFVNTARHMVEALDARGPAAADRRRDPQRHRQHEPRLPPRGPRVRLRLRPVPVRARRRQHAPAPPRGTRRRAAASPSRSASTRCWAARPASPCPAVQDAWLRWLDSLIAAGVDGVDFRISAHGSHTDEPFEYGFNEEILAAAGAGPGERAGPRHDLPRARRRVHAVPAPRAPGASRGRAAARRSISTPRRSGPTPSTGSSWGSPPTSTSSGGDGSRPGWSTRRRCGPRGTSASGPPIDDLSRAARASRSWTRPSPRRAATASRCT